MIETPVLIVGGGPVGLTASIWLSRFGVPSLLIERHPGTAIHPKARGFVLLTGPAGKAWRDSARAVADRLGVPLEALTIGPGDDLHDADNAWTTAYGVDADGAVLVRPDAHVGWRRRSAVADPGVELDRALRGMLGRARR